MPKNKGKGGKNRRRGKNENEETKRQLEFKEPGQEYSQVVRMLGNGRCECLCINQTVSRVRVEISDAPRYLIQALSRASFSGSAAFSARPDARASKGGASAPKSTSGGTASS